MMWDEEVTSRRNGRREEEMELAMMREDDIDMALSLGVDMVRDRQRYRGAVC